jgi:hypothetical protein
MALHSWRIMLAASLTIGLNKTLYHPKMAQDMPNGVFTQYPNGMAYKV